MYAELSKVLTQTHGQIQQVDPPGGSIIYTIGVVKFRIGGVLPL